MKSSDGKIPERGLYIKRLLKFSLSFSLFLFFTLALHATAHAATYYIDSVAGLDSNNGTTISTPWQTIAKVNSSVFQPGDSVLFLTGDTWQGTLTIPSSGTAGNPIIFSSYGSGAQPIIDGNGAANTITGASNISYITIDGFNITDTGATINASQVSINIPSGGTNWTIQNCIIHGSTGKRLRYGIYMSNTTGGSHTIQNNSFQYINERGVYSFIPTSTNLRTNMLVTGNTFDYIAGGGAAKEFPIVGAFNAGSIISNNTITNSSTTAGSNHAIYVYSCDGTGNPVQIKYNKIDHSGLTQQILKIGVSNKYVNVFNNLISNSSDGIAIDGIDAPEINTHINIYNNTLANLTSSNATGIFINYADSVNVKNNLIYEVNGQSTVKTKYNISLQNLTNAVFSNNMAYAASPWITTGDVYAYNDDVFTYYTLPVWNALTGNITVHNDIWSVNPLLTNPSGGDYSLQVGSPAMNAGINVGLTQDILGNPIVGAPDIGAFENQSVPATAYTVTGPTSGSINTASANFTVTPNGFYNGTITITPSGAGLSAPIILTFSNSAVSQTFTVTPTIVGSVSLTPTNSGSLSNPSTLNYTANASAPGSPTSVIANAGNAQATVTFSAPASNGGATITGYTVASIPSGGTDTNTGSTSPSHLITGLTNNTPYTFTVTATNGFATSSASSPSNSVTPIAPATTSTVGMLSGGGLPLSLPQSACRPGDLFNITTGISCPITANVLPSSSASSLPSVNFTKNLSFGMNDIQVKMLQQYLNIHGFPIAIKGAGSLGHETTTFGPATKAALIKFQKAKNISPDIGYFGPITRAFIATR